MLDWLIIGGGIHGTHLSLALLKRARIAADRLRVLDPYPMALARWHDVTRNTDMDFLRSPHVHNLHYDHGALVTYGRINEHEPYTRFIPPFSRPTLELFNRHSAHLIAKHGLDRVRVQGTAQHITRLRDGWRVDTEHGDLTARRVVLAIGMGEQIHIPEWVDGLPPDRVRHIFARGFMADSWRKANDWEHVAVIGGGITAAQVALSFAKVRPGGVTLISRHDVRPHDFDSDPGWMNAIYLRDFANVRDFNQRRTIIRNARHRGSMPPDVRRDLAEALTQGTLNRYETRVNAAKSRADGQICLVLEDGQQLICDRVVLATGYEQHRPGGAWVSALAETHGLPVAGCGYPTPDRTLEWGTGMGLYVDGALAELEIGPAARNIIGARMAGERLIHVV